MTNQNDASYDRWSAGAGAIGKAGEPFPYQQNTKKTGGVRDLKIKKKTVPAIFFHKPDEPYGWLSNWYLSDFELDDMKFSSAEQYIMYQKCVLFGDNASAKKVMSTDDPAQQQEIARNASGFIENVWKGYRQVIAEKALYAKFTQDDLLRDKLLITQAHGIWLVECSRSDKNWACGIGLDDDRRLDASNWTGMNILGFALMKVREDIRKETAAEIASQSDSEEATPDLNEFIEFQDKSTIRIVKKGITKFKVDAVVNAANSNLSYGGGVCGYIFDDAGVNEMKSACAAIGGCKTGHAVITPGFNLPAKYVIHAVGPIWTDGEHNEKKLLYSAYKQSLLLAKENNLHSIAFPLISAGIYGFPKDLAWRKALQACNDFIKDNPDYDVEISFAVVDDDILQLGESVRKDLGI
ncbi:MAG: DUF1768 domain-containing protein [Clostridiales bacterium]|nr:DUF1768 domain-containing protein [Clostridiales bacterium]